MGIHLGGLEEAGAQFPIFTSTKAQILTPQEIIFFLRAPRSWNSRVGVQRGALPLYIYVSFEYHTALQRH